MIKEPKWDLSDRLRVDLYDSSKDRFSFLENWLEAVIRRLWDKRDDGLEIDRELIVLGLGAAERFAREGKLDGYTREQIAYILKLP